ncbi:hypothetical protein ACFFLM_08690 [Deinococcus oregonensis]|uniref:Uncharacterized protein n=1 Tax=Deinococcus oregonensis TaxID=1805970 RepID=A0ABV6AX88_9DEIO
MLHPVCPDPCTCPHSPSGAHRGPPACGGGRGASTDAPEADPAPSRAPRNMPAPHALPDDGWDRVAAGLRMLSVSADDLDVAAAAHEFAQEEARKNRDTYGLKVAERLALQARREAAALRGEYGAANAAWDRLFDVVTALCG